MTINIIYWLERVNKEIFPPSHNFKIKGHRVNPIGGKSSTSGRKEMLHLMHNFYLWNNTFKILVMASRATCTGHKNITNKKCKIIAKIVSHQCFNTMEQKTITRTNDISSFFSSQVTIVKTDMAKAKDFIRYFQRFV